MSTETFSKIEWTILRVVGLLLLLITVVKIVKVELSSLW